MSDRVVRKLAIIFTIITGLSCGTLVAQELIARQAPLDVQITFPTQEALHGFINAESNSAVVVDQVQGTTATLSVFPEDFQRLTSAGYALTLIPMSVTKQFTGYHTVASVQTELEAYAEAFPDICRLESLGTSINGNDIWVLRITDNPDLEEDEPEFKYIGTIHGNENLATEMCMYFIDMLLNGYSSNDDIRVLVDETDISILPLMNPDGLELSQRQNARYVDLNRSFPSYPTDFTGMYFEGEDMSIENREPEVAAVMNWSAANNFVLSANFHTGVVVVNYPFDNIPGISSGQDAPTPDDLLFEEISLRYAELNPPMFSSTEWDYGITNGSEWYSILGGMQDWNYRYLGCMEVTIELSNVYRPATSQIPQYWEDNRESMIAYLSSVHMGLRGITSDKNSNEPLWTRVTVTDNTQPVFSDSDVGDYYRLLLPGTYDVRFEADGYIPYTVSKVEIEEGFVTRMDVGLSNGDLNGDQRIDAVDVQASVNAVLGIADPYDADVDGGGLSATDIQAVVLRALLRTE